MKFVSRGELAQESKNSDSPVLPQPRKKSTVKILYFILGFLALVLVGEGIYYVLLSARDKEYSSTNQQKEIAVGEDLNGYKEVSGEPKDGDVKLLKAKLNNYLEEENILEVELQNNSDKRKFVLIGNETNFYFINTELLAKQSEGLDSLGSKLVSLVSRDEFFSKTKRGSVLSIACDEKESDNESCKALSITTVEEFDTND